MIKRMILMILALAVVLGGIFGWRLWQIQQMQQQMAGRKPPPVTVTTTQARAATWRPELTAVGDLRAAQGVAVSSEVSGRVTDIPFRSGQEVAAGELLVALNSETEEAELDRLRARRDLAETQLRRQRELIRKNQTSQAAVDEAEAELKTLRAEIEKERTLIAKRRIRAPFAGVAGIRQVDVGQYVSPGQALVTLQDLDPLYVDFTLPQQELDRIAAGMAVTVTVDTFPERTFRGEISALESRVAQGTRSFAVRATLPNEERRLRPGMFARVAVQLPVRREVVTLPQTAVTTNPYGESVFLVREKEGPEGEPMRTVTRKFIQTGDRRGDQVAITEGVAAGDTVVTTGQLKLREGAAIRVNNEVRPADQAAPTPENR